MKIKNLILVSIVEFLERIVKPLIRFGFSLYYKKTDKLKPLPKCQSELLLLPAHRLAQKIRNKEVLKFSSIFK